MRTALEQEVFEVAGWFGENYITNSVPPTRLTYAEAVELVNKRQNIEPLQHGQDIGRFHEKVLLDYFEGIPIFITHYPSHLKPFYMKRDHDDNALNFDLIARVGGELCGGSLREDDYDTLKSRLEQMGRLESLQW